MQTLHYLVAATLDGQIARTDGSFDFFTPVGDEHYADYLDSLRRFSAVVMGRETYEVGLRLGVTDPYPYLDTYVLSASLGGSPNPRVNIVAGNAVEFVRALKRQDGNGIYLCGGAKLAASLLEAGEVDVITVKLNPLLLGTGIPLFQHVREPRLLKLAATKTYGNGVLLLSYHT
ncbi:MAG: dihydrofolate reductase family protein [Bryobacteraceae bacterium]|nr:dihydrofolate reductase family protein [Bryobacteraceae bacterium]